MICVGDDGRVAFTKVLSTPPAYDRAVVSAVAELAAGAPVGERRARDDRRDERRARTARRAARARHDGGLPRRARAAPDADAAPLRLLLDEAAVARRRGATASRSPSAWPPTAPCVKPLDEDEARALAARLREAGVEAVAVCLLHAHLHPAHEQRLGEILRAELPGVPVSLSSEVTREQQEYERTATTVVNAYVAPLMGRYVADLRGGLDAAGVAAPLTVLQSSGGTMTRRGRRDAPGLRARVGPGRGVVAALSLAQQLGHENAIAFDMGGTTAKASLIQDGRVSLSQEYEVGAALSAGSRLLRGSGELIRIPTIDIAEVGAGGGSIAWLDEAGGLHVGPRSAGAVARARPATGSAAPSRR